MLGGHWWDGWSSYPTSSEAETMALDLLRDHLGITAKPAASQATLLKDCIPQYEVGYQERCESTHGALLEEYKGRLKLVGNQYNGVGVNDCTWGAWEMAKMTKKLGWRQPWTGLERQAGSKWVLVNPNDYSWAGAENVAEKEASNT